MKTTLDVKMAGEIPEVWIYGVIGEPEDGITAKQFRAAISEIRAPKQTIFRINSEGGLTGDGLAIYESIKRMPGKKIVEIDGIALSAASLIAMAGDEIRIAQNAMMMIHEPWDVASGNAAGLRRKADQLDKWRSVIVPIYSQRTRIARDEVSTMMAAETWMDSGEAVKLGFADNVTGRVAVAAKFDPAKFSNVPEMAFRAAGIDRPLRQRYAIETEKMRQSIG